METAENLAWQEVNCEHIVRDEWIDFRKSTYKMPNGKNVEQSHGLCGWSAVTVTAFVRHGLFVLRLVIENNKMRKGKHFGA